MSHRVLRSITKKVRKLMPDESLLAIVGDQVLHPMKQYFENGYINSNETVRTNFNEKQTPLASNWIADKIIAKLDSWVMPDIIRLFNKYPNRIQICFLASHSCLVDRPRLCKKIWKNKIRFFSKIQSMKF